jgi:hypothetical protein
MENTKEFNMSKIVYTKQQVVQSLIEIGKGIGMGKTTPIREISNYVSCCVESFNLGNEDGSRILLDILELYKKH